jgi:L-aminopeptidase/D-esterase-like protein
MRIAIAAACLALTLTPAYVVSGFSRTVQRSSSMNTTLTAVPGIKVGHHTLTARPTGCTVILAEAGATAAVDVRGAAPATRDTDLLDPVNSVQQVHAVVLSGGSAFGLDTTAGVMRYLEERKIGYAFGNARVPIAPAASLFDLGLGDPTIRPGQDCGYQASNRASADAVAEGSIGAGAGATVGKASGLDRAMKSGVGSSSHTFQNGVIVAALVVVNAFGDVIDPATGQIVAGVRAGDGRSFADARKLLRSGAIRFGTTANNTTLGVVATNARLTKTETKRVAQVAHDGFARAIAPAHTPVDGDTIFALATGGRNGAVDVGVIGAVAADVMAEAILRAVTQATGLPNLPAVRDLREAK